MASDSTELLAARALLLALRASLPAGVTVPTSQVVITPNPKPFTETEAATDLAGRPKPINCVPTVVEGMLSLQVEGLEPSWVRTLDAIYRDETSGPDNQACFGPDAIVLLKGRNEELRLPGSAYGAWRRDYQLPPSSWLGGGPPSEQERADGITFVWKVGRAEPVSDEDFPEEVRPFIRQLRPKS